MHFNETDAINILQKKQCIYRKSSKNKTLVSRNNKMAKISIYEVLLFLHCFHDRE